MSEVVRLKKKGHGTVPLFHTACGARLFFIKNCDLSEAYDAILRVITHAARQGWRCPRCKLFLYDARDIVPSLDEAFVPVLREDESGLVGFGPEFSSSG